jgi:hypothetical protein
MRYIILFLLFTGMAFNTNAQSDITVSDLMVRRLYPLNSLGSPDTTASINISVNFKISKIDSTDTVFLLMGSAKDSSNVLLQQANKISTQGVNYLSFSGQNDSLYANIEASHTFILSSAQWKKTKYVTVYLKDISGNYSSRVYFEKRY